MRGARFTRSSLGKAPADRLTLKPYWGKPTVRNFRGGGGNVGIIRSPVRATALPNSRITNRRAELNSELRKSMLGAASEFQLRMGLTLEPGPRGHSRRYEQLTYMAASYTISSMTSPIASTPIQEIKQEGTDPPVELLNPCGSPQGDVPSFEVIRDTIP